MGLDNGIYMKRKNKNIKVPKWIDYWEFGEVDKEFVDICYWRKWYHFKKEVLALNLKLRRCYDICDNTYELSVEDLQNILKILKSYNKRNWSSDNYWEWAEVKRFSIPKNKKALKWAIRQKKKYKDEIDFVFYDSF